MSRRKQGSSLEQEHAKLRARAERGKASQNQLRRLAAIEEQIRSKQETTRQNVQHAVTPKTKRLRLRECSEKDRIHSALEDAQSLGLISVTDYGDPHAEKRCIVIGSSHGDPHTREMSQVALQAQYELFAFMYILEQYNASNTLLVEGTEVGVRPYQSVIVPLPGRGNVDLQSAEAQQYFFDRPHEFQHLMSDMIRDGCDPSFFTLTKYQHIEGAHSPEILDQVTDTIALLHQERTFFAKYQPPTRGNDTATPQQHDGKWWIYINNQWFDPKEIYEDSLRALQTCDARDAISAAREEEVTNHFLLSSPENVPFSWVGLSHMNAIRDRCLEKNMAVRTVTPVAEKNIKIPKDPREIASLIGEFARVHYQQNIDNGFA